MLPNLGGNNSNIVELVMRWVSDPASKAKVISDVKEVADATKKATQEQAGGADTSNPPGYAAYAKAYEEADAKLKQFNSTQTKSAQQGLALFQAYTSIGEYEKQNFGQISQDTEAHLAELSKYWQDYGQGLQQVEQEHIRLARGLMYTSQALQQVGQYALIAGAAISAGLIATANDYIKSGVEITRVTTDWKKAQNDIADAQLRMGKVTSQTLLPAYKELARLQTLFAQYLETHPEAAGVAGGIGAFLSVAGTLMTLAAGGIRVYADISFATSTTAWVEGNRQFGRNVALFTGAVEKQSVTAPVSGGLGGLAGKVGTVALYAAAVIIEVAAATALANALVNVVAQVQGKPQPAQFSAGDLLGGGILLGLGAAAAKIAGGLSAAGIASEDYGKKTRDGIIQLEYWIASAIHATHMLDSLQQSAKDAGIKLEELGATGGAGATPGISEAVRAQVIEGIVGLYRNYAEAEDKAAQDNADALVQIRKDLGKREEEIATTNAAAIQRIDSDNAKAVQRIEESNAAAIERINSSFAVQMANDYANFALSEKHAQENYALQRQETITGEGEKILSIEKDLQKKLKQLESDHSDKMYDLALSRDALGLVREQRSYDKARQSAVDDANDQIAAEKRQTAITLREAAARYNLERAQARDNFEQQIQQATDAHARQLAEQQVTYQNQLSAQAQAHADQLAEQQKAYNEQMAQAQADARDRTAQQQEQFNREHNARLVNLQRAINDLYYQADVEAYHKSVIYNRMLAAADAFMVKYAAALDPALHINIPSLTTAPIHDYTGYAYPGPYMMAQSGIPQYVLSGHLTQLAEGILGGHLNERSLMAALMLGAGGGGSVQWNDHRRFDAQISQSMRRVNKQDTMETLSAVIKKGR